MESSTKSNQAVQEDERRLLEAVEKHQARARATVINASNVIHLWKAYAENRAIYITRLRNEHVHSRVASAAHDPQCVGQELEMTTLRGKYERLLESEVSLEDVQVYILLTVAAKAHLFQKCICSRRCRTTWHPH